MLAAGDFSPKCHSSGFLDSTSSGMTHPELSVDYFDGHWDHPWFPVVWSERHICKSCHSGTLWSSSWWPLHTCFPVTWISKWVDMYNQCVCVCARQYWGTPNHLEHGELEYEWNGFSFKLTGITVPWMIVSYKKHHLQACPILSWFQIKISYSASDLCHMHLWSRSQRW